MDHAEAAQVLKQLGSVYVESSPGANGWQKASCPFAPYRHAKGRDDNPSFAIKAGDGRWGYSCFSCGAKGGSLRRLLSELSRHRVIDRTIIERVSKLESGAPNMSRAHGISADKAPGEIPVGLFGPKPDVDTSFQLSMFNRHATVACLEESELDRYDEGPCPYLESRGFTMEVIKRWGLMVDNAVRAYPRVVFPVRDEKGRLLAFSKRVTSSAPVCQSCGYESPPKEVLMSLPKSHADRLECKWGMKSCPRCGKWVWPKYQHSKGYQRNKYLYGEHLIDTSLRAGVLVEGNLDPIRLSQFGVKNAVASLGSKLGMAWGDEENPGDQLWKLTRHFDLLYAVPDGDEAGSQWLETLTSFFKPRAHLLTVIPLVLKPGQDPGGLTCKEVEELFCGTKVYSP